MGWRAHSQPAAMAIAKADARELNSPVLAAALIEAAAAQLLPEAMVWGKGEPGGSGFELVGQQASQTAGHRPASYIRNGSGDGVLQPAVTCRQEGSG